MNTKHLARTAPLALAATLLVGACTGFGLAGRGGEGAVTTETRAVAPFTQIEATNGVRVLVRIEPGVKIGASQPVEVRAQPNLHAIIATESTGGTLRISATEAYRTSEGIEIAIVTSTLAGISLSGGSRAEIEGLDEDDFRVALTGGSVAAAGGRAVALGVEGAGGSRAELDEIDAETVTLDVTGGSVVNVMASGSVGGSASGGSRVVVSGGAQVNVVASGGSTVTTR
jgi:hypothetical protein